MKKIFSSLTFIIFISFVIFIQSCKEEENPTAPTERPVYEGSGSVGPIGAIIHVNNQNSPIKGAYIDIPQGALSSNVNILISQAPTNVKYLEDSTALIIQFEPKGLEFNNPVKIGIPYGSVTNSNFIKAYYFNPDSNYLQQIPIESINSSEKVVTASISHFSFFLVDDDGVFATVNMYKRNGKISANVFLEGYYNGINYGLLGIPTRLEYQLQGVFNIKQMIDHQSFLIGNRPPVMVFRIKLKKKVNFWADPTLDTKSLDFERTVPVQGNLGGKLYLDHNNAAFLNTDLEELYYIESQSSSERESWYSGEPLLFNFNFEPNSTDEYYVEADWVVAGGYTFNYLDNPVCKVYSFNNYEFRKKLAQMSSTNPDVNDNYIVDTYETNIAPIEPNNPTPPDGSTDQSIDVDISWQCSDTNNDPLHYDIYFGTNQNPPLVVNGYTLTGFDPGQLNTSTDYYWKIIAKDDHLNSTSGPVWTFSTSSQGSLPLPPILSSPINGATNISITPTLAWNQSVGATSYDLLVFDNQGTIVFEQSGSNTSQQISGLNFQTIYFWKVKASNIFGESDWSEVWHFTTSSLGSGWVRKEVGANDYLFDVEHINNTIWLCGANGVVIKSIDGGNNWTLSSLGADRGLLSIDFIDENLGWTNDWFGIFYTSNGGSNWTRQLSLNEDTTSIRAIKFANQNVGWGAGEYWPNQFSAAKFWRTTDGGNNWSEIIPEYGGSLSDIHLLNEFEGIAVGNGGTIFRLANGGTNWEFITPSYLYTQNISTVYMINQNLVWIGTDQGKIYKSSDGGNSWQEQNSGTSEWLYDCYFTDDDTGWFVGANGTILITDTGGLNWNFQTSNTNEFLLSVDFISPTKGFIVGENGLLLKTTTGGN